MNEQKGFTYNDEIYSKSIRTKNRTYFFDVKQTKNQDYFITLTESKKVYDQEGNSKFEKHKIFLYREDFEAFAEELQNTLDFIQTQLQINPPLQAVEQNE